MSRQLVGFGTFTSVAAQAPHALFFVNVADIDALRGLSSFVACTTEKIFVHKTDMYDVFVDNQNIVVSARGGTRDIIVDRSARRPESGEHVWTDVLCLDPHEQSKSTIHCPSQS